MLQNDIFSGEPVEKLARLSYAEDSKDARASPLCENEDGGAGTMSEEFGNNYVVLTDEDGNEAEFEHIDTVEVDGETYMAFIPADLKAEEEAEVVILKVVEEDGEEVLSSLEDEAEADRIFEIVMERVEDMFEDEEEE